MPQPTPPLLVFRSNDICFLGILRSCHAANIPTVSITFDWPGAGPWHSERSAGFQRSYRIANPYTDAAQAVSDFREIARQLSEEYGRRLMVLPSSDTNMMFLLDHFEQFSAYIQLMGDRRFEGARLDVAHKSSCAQLLSAHAAELSPLTLRCQQSGDIETVVQQMRYPAVYKPAVKDYGQTFYKQHGGNKAIECGSAEELRDKLLKEMAEGFDLVVQEKIFFDSVHDEIPFYLYADAAGRVRMAANGIKEVIEPFPFGTAILLRFAWREELLALAQQVVDALSWRGILMIEFVKDKKDDRWKVIEVNTRPWLFNGFYQRLGLNYTAMLYRDWMGELPEAVGPDDRVIASPETLSRNWVHIDALELARKWAAEEPGLTTERFFDRLGCIDGSISAAFYDPEDTGPGVARFEQLCSEMAWDASALDQLVAALD